MKKLADISSFERLGASGGVSDVSVFNFLASVDLEDWWDLRSLIEGSDEVMWRSFGLDDVHETDDEDKREEMFNFIESICESNPGTSIFDLLNNYAYDITKYAEYLTAEEEEEEEEEEEDWEDEEEEEDEE